MKKKLALLLSTFFGASALCQDRMDLTNGYFDGAIKSRFGADISVGVPLMEDVRHYDIEFYEVKKGEKVSFGPSLYQAERDARSVKIDENKEVLDCHQEGDWVNCYRGTIGKLTTTMKFSDYFSPASELERSENGIVAIKFQEFQRTNQSVPSISTPNFISFMKEVSHRSWLYIGS